MLDRIPVPARHVRMFPFEGSLLLSPGDEFFFEGGVYRPHLWMPDYVNDFEDVESYSDEFGTARAAVLDCCNGETTDRFGASCGWLPTPVR